jgi:hypothetical protein
MSSSSTLTRFSSRLDFQALNRFLLFLGVLLPVAHGGGAFEVLLLDRFFLLLLDLLDLGLDLLELRRTGHGADARP